METLTLEKKIAALPDDLKLQVEGFVDALLSDKANQNIPGNNAIVTRGYGSMKGLIKYIADDFDAPLEDFKDYM